MADHRSTGSEDEFEVDGLDVVRSARPSVNAAADEAARLAPLSGS